MKKLFNKLIYLGYDKKAYYAVKQDVREENRRSLVLYSSIVVGGMGILLLLSLFVSVLVSSRFAYIVALAIGLVLLFVALFPAKKNFIFTIFGQYILSCALLTFGIYLGTIAEPNQASASFAVLMFVVPLLFNDLPYRTNIITVFSIIAYAIAAKNTQTPEMFAFNMSIIMPYGLANLIVIHFTSKFKIERCIYAHEKKLLSEIDTLTKLYNRHSLEDDVNDLKKLSDRIVKICSFDVNGLKVVNDRFGHQAGDELLIAASKAIKNVFGKYGKCYRIGGDEFIVVIDGESPSGDELRERLNKETENYRGGNAFILAIACGITEGSNKNIEKLVNEADRQMYFNKEKYYVDNGINRRSV